MKPYFMLCQWKFRLKQTAVIIFAINLAYVSELQSQTFTNVAAAAGVDLDGNKEGGHCWADFNNDGYLDLLLNTSRNANTHRTRLYFNNGDGTFTDVTNTHADGLINGFGAALGRSAVAADVNNDGYVDFARNNPNRVEFYLNKGPTATPPYSFGDAAQLPNWEATDGTATDLSAEDMNTEGMAMFDYNGDGWNDLIIDNHSNGTYALGLNSSGVDPCTSVSFIHDGFVATGLGAVGGNSDGDYLGVGDLNADGFSDLILRKDDTEEDLYMNDGDGSFTLNTNYSGQTANNGNKGGISLCDFDMDGDLDILWSTNDGNVIHENIGGNPVNFTVHNELTTGLTTASVDGCDCGDIDNDGDIDLFLASNGGTSFLYLNNGTGNFTGMFTQNNLGINVNANAESTTFVDYDNDGDLDIYVSVNGDNQLWNNDLLSAATPLASRNYLKVRVVLQNDASANSEILNRSMIGAQVFLRETNATPGAGNLIAAVEEVNAGKGHGSQKPSIVHFSVPDPTQTYEVTVISQSITGLRRTKRVTIVPNNASSFGRTDQTLTMNMGGFSIDERVCNPALPVEYVQFEAKQHQSTVELKWKTINEDNNSHFDIQHSIDGIRFQDIGQVYGTNTQNHIISSYTFHQNNADASINYYRLLQYDFDGTCDTSKIISVTSESKHTCPCSYSSNELTMPSSELIYFDIFSASGRSFKKAINFSKTRHDTLTADLSSLTYGMYFIKCRTSVLKIFKL